MTRLVLFVLPLLIFRVGAGFEIREVWYLSVASQIFQACLNLVRSYGSCGRNCSFPTDLVS